MIANMAGIVEHSDDVIIGINKRKSETFS